MSIIKSKKHLAAGVAAGLFVIIAPTALFAANGSDNTGEPQAQEQVTTPTPSATPTPTVEPTKAPAPVVEPAAVEPATDWKQLVIDSIDADANTNLADYNETCDGLRGMGLTTVAEVIDVMGMDVDNMTVTEFLTAMEEDTGLAAKLPAGLTARQVAEVAFEEVLFLCYTD